MKRYIALLLLLALTLWGCNAQPGEAAAPPATAAPTQPPQVTAAPTQDPNQNLVELRVWVGEDFLWSDPETLDAMLAEFNAYYPNIRIQVEPLADQQTSGDKPNLILGSTELLAQWPDPLADLSELWENLQEDVYAPAQARCRDENGWFALPLCLVVDCMAVNRTMLENAQAMALLNESKHTWSAGNFLQVGENLYDSGLENALTIYCQDTEGDVYTRLLLENLYGASYVNPINGTYNANADAMVRAIRELRKGHGFLYQRNVTADGAMEAFLNGESAMVLNWNSALQLTQPEDSDILFMLYPATGKAKTYGQVYGLGVVQTEDPTQAAASMTFAAYIAHSDAAIRATGQLPARSSGLKAYAGTALEEAMAELSVLLDHLAEGEKPGLCWEEARQLWVQMLQEVSKGTDPNYCPELCRVWLIQLLLDNGYDPDTGALK